jgi:hypothetical protein
MTKAHTHNIGLAIWRLKFFYETFVQGPTAVILLNFCAKNRHIAKPQTVICYAGRHKQTTNKNKRQWDYLTF